YPRRRPRSGAARMAQRKAYRGYREILRGAPSTLYREGRIGRGNENRRGVLMRRDLFSFILPLVFVAQLSAHEVRPAYLQLRQSGADTYDVFWKVPAVGDTMRLSLYVELPRICSNLARPHGSFSGGAYTEQWSVTCPGGLSGSTIRIS